MEGPSAEAKKCVTQEMMQRFDSCRTCCSEARNKSMDPQERICADFIKGLALSADLLM